MGKRLLIPVLLLAAGVAAGFLWGRMGAPPAGGGETSSGSESAQVRTWKMASLYPGSLPIRGEDAVQLADEVTRATNGRLTIKHYDPGKLVPPIEIFDAVSKGSVDAGWSAAGFWIGKIPSSALFSAIPFGPDVGEYLGWMFEGGGLEIYREIYARHDVHVEPCSMTPPEASGWFREPIERMSDFNGKKLRYFGLGGKVLQKAGASVQLLAVGDIYPALERGVLDGLEYAMPVMDARLGFSRIAKHYYFPGWHQPTSFGELIINMNRWNELTDQDKLIVRIACQASMVRNMAKGETLNSAPMAQFKQEGVTLHYWSDEILKELYRLSNEVMAEEAAADPDFARAWESLRGYRERNTDWVRMSRLPPGFGR